MDLSILIVNWNSARYLRDCLASICREIKGIEFEVLVVDNASYDGSAELVRTSFPQATFIQSDKNLGFTRGNNLLFGYARGRNILLLNPDTLIVDDAIQKMLGYLESLPQAGAIGCRLVDAEGALQTSIQAFPTILNQLLDVESLQRRFPNCSIWKLKPLYEESAVPVQVDSLAGACFMIKRHVFEQVGLMSEDYVMYGDDIDLSYKVWKAGFKVFYTNQWRVIHYEGRSAESLKKGLPDLWKRAMIHKFLSTSRGRWYGAVYKTLLASTALVRLGLIAVMKLLVGDSRQKERLGFAFTKWKRLFQWAVGVKEWARCAGQQAGFGAKEW
jgi:GT2 family glycosyltransferase